MPWRHSADGTSSPPDSAGTGSLDSARLGCQPFFDNFNHFGGRVCRHHGFCRWCLRRARRCPGSNLSVFNVAIETFYLDPQALVELVLLVQLVALPGATAMGWLSGRVSREWAAGLCLAGWAVVLALVGLITTVPQLYALVVLLALVWDYCWSSCLLAGGCCSGPPTVQPPPPEAASADAVRDMGQTSGPPRHECELAASGHQPPARCGVGSG